MDNIWDKLLGIIDEYVQLVREELHARWDAWPLDLSKSEIHEAIGALLARQVTLATQLAGTPAIWNGHIAPLILRSMADVHITLAWILIDPLDRSRKFILYGLGQEKLEIEHHKTRLVADGQSEPESDPFVQARLAWLNAQRYEFLTEVNVGSWSGLSTREMAEQAGILDFYRYVYTPFSAATHSMWQHVAKYNLITCDNPLHRYHKIPVDPDIHLDPDYLMKAAKYVAKTFAAFDDSLNIKIGSPSAFERLEVALGELEHSDPEQMESKAQDVAEGSTKTAVEH